MGRAEVTLRQDRPTALELSLDGVQAPVPGVAGLGHGRLVLLPFADQADQQAGQRLNSEGTTRHAQGDVDGAVADFRAALAKSPLDTTARGNLALLLTGEAAVEEALICIGLDSTLLPGWMVLARAAMVTGAFGVARRIAEILDGLPGGGPVAANLRAALPA